MGTYLTLLVDICATLAAHPHLLTVFVYAEADTGALIALGADEHHVTQVKWCFEFDNSGLNLLPPGLHRPLVLLGDVNLCHDHTVFFANDAQYFSTRPDVFAGDDFDSIALLNAMQCPVLRLKRFRG